MQIMVSKQVIKANTISRFKRFQIQECGDVKEFKVTASLVCKDEPYRPHPHSLVGKDCNEGICRVTIKPSISKTHSFTNLGIQCVKKKEMEEAFQIRQKNKVNPFNTSISQNVENIDMNVVRICFQADFCREDGEVVSLFPVLSQPIYDKKAPNTSELKICKMNKNNGLCTGGEEVYLLCEKVQKEDIIILFSAEGWEAKGDFAQTDVHRQVGIVFKTPPYCDLSIKKAVEVKVRLKRDADGECSEPFPFTYLPQEKDTYGVQRKRRRMNDSLGAEPSQSLMGESGTDFRSHLMPNPITDIELFMNQNPEAAGGLCESSMEVDQQEPYNFDGTVSNPEATQMSTLFDSIDPSVLTDLFYGKKPYFQENLNFNGNASYQQDRDYHNLSFNLGVPLLDELQTGMLHGSTYGDEISSDNQTLSTSGNPFQNYFPLEQAADQSQAGMSCGSSYGIEAKPDGQNFGGNGSFQQGDVCHLPAVQQEVLAEQCQENSEDQDQN
nr:PREDICTED: transcription factor RelB [Latimeria chalumnae]|eukprot:XP_014346558.1 PREDICTED: transcription factor RelB [Latimeria chalumnae]